MSLSIVGGWYEEVCAEPQWNEFYGPGGRAAAALAGRNADIRLFTYCPDSLRPKLDYMAKTFGFFVEFHGSPPSVPRFQYLHWMRSPHHSPGSLNPAELPPICPEAADNVIRYGFYEGDAIVKAKRAVYDPQNAPDKVVPFEQNDSTAEHLVVICNYAEGRGLTKETDTDRILKSLLQPSNVVGVALKVGWEGVWVADRSQRKELIKPIPTNYVHKIGSGDVFSAELGYGWMILGLDPIEAARRASNQVALYSDSASLPIPAKGVAVRASKPDLPKRDGKDKKYDIYLAGPIFNHSQISVIEEMRDIFKDADLTIFSPYHDVGFGHVSHIAKQDLDALRASRIVVGCLEGYDPGTVFEIGYARSQGIPVLVYSPNLSELHSTMFLGSGCELARDFTTAIYRSIWWAKGI